MHRSHWLSLCIVLFGLLVYILQPHEPLDVSAQAASSTPDTSFSESTSTHNAAYRVVRVVDGDTVVVDINGKNTTLRLIGMDTPETVDPRKPVECFGEAASAEAKKLLSGQTVRIEYDASQGNLDAYGRTLAYIYMEDGTLYNEYMIQEGYAHEYTYRIPYRYQAEFKTAERAARSEKKGLWASDACATESSRT